MFFFTCVETPINRSFSLNIFIIRKKINLFPNITNKSVFQFLPSIIRLIKPIRSKNSNFKMHYSALSIRIQSVIKRGTVIPFQIIKKLSQLLLNYVEISAVRPIVPEIVLLESSFTGIHEQDCVELFGPYGGNWIWWFWWNWER